MLKKQKRGITLISLVITIILLLILAMVAISLAVDSDGLFSKAGDAANKWNTSVKEENTTWGNILTIMNEVGGSLVQKPELEPGLYETGTTNMIMSWEELKEIYIGVKDGVLQSGSINLNGDIVIDGEISEIDDYAFYCCYGLTSITIPDSVKSIGEYAFEDCYSLTSVTIPDGVTWIDYCAFYECSGLTSITIPASVTSIGDYAFSGCSSLTSITVEEGNAVYDSRNNCNAIIETASNTLLFGSNNTIIPDSVTSINEWAFWRCSSLTNIIIPDGVTSVGESAFYECSGLTSITIPASVISIGEYAFWSCLGLTSIIVEEENTVYDSRNNCNAIIETASNTLLFGCNNTAIPYGVTSIDNDAFCYFSGLTSITIPSSVTSIGAYAFYGCSGLTDIIIPASVTSIYDDAFYSCSSLTIYCEASSEPSGWTCYSWNSSDRPVVWGYTAE